MPACSTCGGTDDVRLYRRHDVDYEARTLWWCVKCSYVAGRLNRVAAEPVARWVERAVLHGLTPKPVDVRWDRRVSVGRRATDRGYGVEA